MCIGKRVFSQIITPIFFCVHRENKTYYYRNSVSQHTQWTYPEELSNQETTSLLSSNSTYQKIEPDARETNIHTDSAKSVTDASENNWTSESSPPPPPPGVDSPLPPPPPSVSPTPLSPRKEIENEPEDMDIDSDSSSIHFDEIETKNKFSSPSFLPAFSSFSYSDNEMCDAKQPLSNESNIPSIDENLHSNDATKSGILNIMNKITALSDIKKEKLKKEKKKKSLHGLSLKKKNMPSLVQKWEKIKKDQKKEDNILSVP